MKLSRRALLAGGGAALMSLAGCSRLDFADDSPTYDTEALATLGETGLPRPPAAFPVSIPAAMVENHRTRARTIIDRVPEDVAVPNGAITRQLRRKREEVIEDLTESDADRTGPRNDPLDRLGDARNTRTDAAAVAAAYRAATDDITANEVAGRREELRDDLIAFDRKWRYRGADAATALIVHRELEDLRRNGRRGATPERAFPTAPKAAVFRVGEIVRRLEDGRAALTDAEQIRSQYVDAGSDPQSFATALTVGAARLRRRNRQREARLHEYVETDPDQLPFERNIEGTALEEVYRRAAASVRRRNDEARQARRRGAHATALIEIALAMTTCRMFEAIITAIRTGELTPPTSVGEIRSAQQRAIERAETAWNATPTPVAAALTRPAQYLLQRGTKYLGEDRFDESPPDSGDAERAFASFVRAGHYAAAVPETISDLHDVYLTVPSPSTRRRVDRRAIPDFF